MSNVRDFGAVGDGAADDTAAIQHALGDGDGRLEFPPGTYRLTKTIEILLDQRGPSGITGSDGTARVVMDGPGPAFRLVGTHAGTGDPNSVTDAVRIKQRLPSVSDIEITGSHPAADGLELIGTMQPMIRGVLIQRVRHGIRLHQRNRNVIIADSQIYFNTGVGVFLDAVNLHQININSNHISYNRLGGIRIANSEIRNLQITGNDIEYNNHRAHQTDPEPTAEIDIDTTAEGASVAEVMINGNTIQATESPDGANIRIIGDPLQKHRPGLWTITGNVIGSQEVNVKLVGCHSLSITGNCIYSGAQRNLIAEQCTQLNLSGNDFRRHSPAFNCGLRFVDCVDSLIQGCSVKDETESGQPNGALVEFSGCIRMTITGCQFLDGVPYCVDLQDCRQMTFAHCNLLDTRRESLVTAAVRWQGAGDDNVISDCRIGPAGIAGLQLAKESQVQVK